MEQARQHILSFPLCLRRVVRINHEIGFFNQPIQIYFMGNICTTNSNLPRCRSRISLLGAHYEHDC